MQVQEYSPRWQTKVSALANRVLGKGFFENPSEIAQDPESCVFVCITEDEEASGFVCGRLLRQGDLRVFLEHRVADIPPDLDKADAEGVLGVIQTVVVAPEFQGKGIGTRLLRVAHDTIVGIGADKLIVTFKRGSTSTRVGRLMDKLDFEFWLKLDTYWKTRCDLGDFTCVDRNETCTCEAMFYRKRVF